MKKISMAVIAIMFLVQSVQAIVPTLAETFSTDIYVYNGTTLQREKIYSADNKIRQIVHSEEFKDRIINFTYNGVKRFVDNGGLTNTQIYYKILNGAEKLLPTEDNQMDLKVKTYYEYSSTVGWTSTSSMYINLNTRYLNSYTANETAKTLMHEWLHKLGFTHSRYSTSSRNYSVPYGVGKIIMDLAAKY